MNYGLTTWTQPVPTGGGPVSLFVAGMKGNTLYHMRGVVQFADGSQYMDPDLMFTTGAYPAAQLPVITATTTAGMTPQSGVELLDLQFGHDSPVAVRIWMGMSCGATTQGYRVTFLNPIKLLPNGHFWINFSGIDESWDGCWLRLTGSGPNGQADLANDSCGPEQGAGRSHLCGLQHHDHRNASRFCDAAKWAPNRDGRYPAGHFRNNGDRRRNHRSGPEPQSCLAVERI